MTALRPAPPLVRIDRPDPARPLVASGLAAAVLFGGSGDGSCVRETRGGAVEWGGVYGQGIRLTGPLRLELADATGPIDLAAQPWSLEAWRWAIHVLHRLPGSIELHRLLVPFPEAPGVGIRLRLHNGGGTASQLQVTSASSPSLAPILVEGIEPYEYDLTRVPGGLQIRSHGHAVSVARSRAPAAWTVNGRSWSGSTIRGPVGAVTATDEATVEPGRDWSVDTVVWGGVERALGGFRRFGGDALAAADAWEPAGRRAWSGWLDRCPTLEFPDDPGLTQGFVLARSALRALYARPDPLITGLLAGFPWYCSVWGRDLAWMLPAVVWMGDAEWAAASLRTIFHFQAPRTLALLAATSGELPMQVSPGPIFLFGTSDTTLYYPGVLAQYAAHTGDLGLVGELFEGLLRVRGWVEAKTDSVSGLIRNGGEVLALRDAAERIGSTHYGIDAADTTIWDSADRRDHAIDVQVLAIGAYRSLDELATLLGRQGEMGELQHRADAIATAVRTRYDWPAEQYLYDSVSTALIPRAEVRPNALRAVSAGLLDGPRSVALVRRALADDLRTGWGVRTLSSHDPKFDPQAYHEGQVWPIATAWAADAALRAGEVDSAIELLDQIAGQIVREDGLSQECYRGDRAEPFDSCFLLGFSVAPFLTTLFDSLWGIRVDARAMRISVAPRFPARWRRARVTHLRIGAGYVDLAWVPGQLVANWTGPGALGVEFGGSSSNLAPGASLTMGAAA